VGLKRKAPPSGKGGAPGLPAAKGFRPPAALTAREWYTLARRRVPSTSRRPSRRRLAEDIDKHLDPRVVMAETAAFGEALNHADHIVPYPIPALVAA
jgi:hypothetical protein